VSDKGVLLPLPSRDWLMTHSVFTCCVICKIWSQQRHLSNPSSVAISSDSLISYMKKSLGSGWSSAKKINIFLRMSRTWTLKFEVLRRRRRFRHERLAPTWMLIFLRSMRFYAQAARRCFFAAHAVVFESEKRQQQRPEESTKERECERGRNARFFEGFCHELQVIFFCVRVRCH
jgi:hypothetical protein